VNEGRLRNWVDRDKAARCETDAVSEDERAELARLRAEVVAAADGA
jgi:hypothetical protein